MQLHRSISEQVISDSQQPSAAAGDPFIQAHRKPPQRETAPNGGVDPILTVEDVARRLNVSRDWVWDHSSRKTPRLPVIRMGDGTLRYRASAIEDFICERESATANRARSR